MRYDAKLLEAWCKMPDWGDYLIANGGLTKYSSKEGFEFLQEEYYAEVERRIEYCQKLLREHKDALIYYTLAELYDRCNEDRSYFHLFKWIVRYYAILALEIDPSCTGALELLNRVKDWIKLIGDIKGE